MAEKNDVIEVGDTVHTPDGEGKVTGIDSRYVSVDLENGSKANFAHREVYEDEKLSIPSSIKSPEPKPAEYKPHPEDDSVEKTEAAQ